MTESQYAVFQFDVKTMSMGGSETPLIFDSLSAAEGYSQEKMTASPGLGFRILDRDGKIVRTFTNAQLYEKFHGQPAAKRSLLMGALYLVIGIALITLDVHLGFSLIFGVFLGVRFLWVAGVKLIDGFTGLEHNKK
jgi:hypothetical protein